MVCLGILFGCRPDSIESYLFFVLIIVIIYASSQAKVTTTSMTLFNGGSNPGTHLEKFTDLMSSMCMLDATQCQLFPLTLGGQAYRWFQSLPPNSIEIFHHLKSLFLSHFGTLAPRPATMQIFANIQQGPTESDRDYIERVDKVILGGEPMGDEAKVMGAVKGLRLNTKLWMLMYKEYPSSYAKFRWKTDNHISKAEMMALRLGEQGTSKEMAKPDQKPSSSHRRGGAQQKPANNFKSFNNVIEVKLLEVLNTALNGVSDQIKDKKLLNQPRKITKENYRMNPNKYCHYHESIDYNTSECRDLLKQLWKLYEDGKLNEFIKKPSGNQQPSPQVNPAGCNCRTSPSPTFPE